jgi:RNA polymerase sigma factor (sigma-70 family)
VVTKSPSKIAAPTAPASLSLEEAFARFQPELLGALVCLLGNLEDARDALQDSFLKCWRHRDQLPQIVNLKAWVFRIVLNTGRDIRGTAWRRRRQGFPEDEMMVASPQIGPAEAAENEDEVARIRRAVRELREEEQEVFLLRQNADLTYDEIAEAMGIPTGTVKTRMRMALMKLRTTLADAEEVQEA